MNKIIAIAVGLTAVVAAPVAADPDKNESGNGYQDYYERWDRGEYRRDEYRDYRDYSTYRGRYAIPRGHMPPPGECRVWFYDRPAGQQPPPTTCREARIDAYRNGGRVIFGGRR